MKAIGRDGREGRWLGVGVAAVVISLAFAASAMAGGRLYLPGYGSGPPEVMHAFDRGEDGSLTPVSGAPFPLVGGLPPAFPGGAIASAFGPDGSRGATAFLFEGGIQGLSVAADGALAPAGPPALTPSETGIAISPDGRFAYAPTRDFAGQTAVGITGFSFGPNGSLTQLASSPYDSGEFGDVAITPDGRFLFGVIANQVRRFSIAADGALTPLGNTPVGGAQFLDVSPDGRFLFVTSKSSPDTVISFSIDAAGDLSQNGDPAPTGDASLDYIGVAPDGRNLYMPDSNLDGIVRVAIAENGTLTVGETLTFEDAESVVVSPDGRFLYISDTQVLRTASIDAAGRLTVLPFATGMVEQGEPVRMLIQPQPAPQASFTVKSAAPGEPARFDASASARATRYDWDFGDGTVLADGGPTPTHAYAEPGVYDVRLTVIDASGCSTQQVYNGHSTACPGGSAPETTGKLDTLPVLSKLKAKPKRFAIERRAKAKRPRGTKFRYRLTEDARVELKIQRKKKGKRFVGVGKVKDKGEAGKNRKRFRGKVGGKVLRPGRYRVKAIATDSAGGESRPVKARFRIVVR